MKKLLRKSTSLFMALFMVLQVMLPAFATKSKAEEAEPNSIKNIENLDQDPDSYFSLTDSQKIYDKKEKEKDESKFTIAIGLSDTSTKFRLVKRNDLKLYDDRYFPTNEEASKEYWKIKDKLKDQGLDIEIDIIKDDQGYKIVGKNQDQDSKEKPYGINYSYIDFKIIDDFDFNEKGNQKLLEKDKLVFNLEFSQNISPDPSYNLFEKGQDGNYEIKNHGQIFALIDNDKVNIYDTSSLSNDFNELNQYKEDKKSEDERKKLEEEKKAQEEKKKAEEEKKEQEAQKQKEEAEKKAQEEKAKAEEEKKLAEERAEKEKAEEAKKEEEKSAQEEKENQEEAQKAKEDAEKKAQEKKKEADKKLYFPKKEESPKSIMDKDSEESSLSKADKELKEALKNKKLSLEDLQKLLTTLGEKYKLNKADQEKLMTENDKSIRDLVEKDRQENFRALMLRQKEPDGSKSFEGKKFNLKTTMRVKASEAWPIPSGWYFDVNLGPYLKEDIGQQVKDLHHPDLGLVAIAQMLKIGNDNVIRYTYVRKVKKPIELNIDQDLAFDADAIGYQNPITLNIKVAPKNNPVQNLYPITVYKNSPRLVTSEYIVEDQGEYKSGTYPYQLDWRTTSQKLRDKNHSEIKSMIDPKLDGSYVEWDIEVDTKDLINSKETLDFNKLHLTVFGSANQGLKDFSYKVSTSPISVDDTSNFKSSSRLGEILTQDSDIKKSELGDKLYIKVRGKIDPDQVHETYSIGFRINPDKNYIDNLLQEYKDKFDKIPTPIKWLKGVKEAKRFAEVPFNLVETMIPATFNGLRDKFTNERFYYDNTRTIVADRKSDKRADWYALDLIRRGENQDSALDYPTFDLNNGTNNQKIKADKIYFVPRKDGGYRRTSQAGDVVLSNGQYYPGTIVSYEYEDEKGQRNDAYNFRADLKDKKKFNIDEVYDTEGGMVNLFTQKVSDQAIAKGYLAYTEDPYPIMRIDKNFDMVSCFNDRIKAPVYTGSNSVILDKHEDVPGDFLISRLNESIDKKSGDYELKKYLNGTKYDGVFLNHGGMSEGQAMEELMKKIYFYGDEVKKDYAKNNGGKEMHRLIESSMYQRVIHHFTDGKSLEKDYFDAPSSYNVDEWKVPHTLSGTRQTYPKTGWDGSFDGADKKRKTKDGLRMLKDNETQIGNYPPVQSTQYDMAQALYKKVIASYRDGNDWNADKADSVKLVFYSHTDEGKYQELIAGRVMAPIEIDKYKQDGSKLKDAKFRFTNIDTGENKTWTSKDDKNTHKLYLRPGKYKVQEIETPDGYQTIEDFDIEVIREEINKDDGPYRAKKLDYIHVNDGFKTKVALGDNIPETADHKKLVELDGNNIKVKIKNIDDNLGSLEFTKKNKFIRLRGAEFRLRKLKDTSLDKAKKDINSLTDEDFDSNKYDQTSAGDGGDFKFEQIPVGYFVLEETKVPTGYQKAPLYLLQGVKGKDDNNNDTVIVSFVGENAPTETENKKTIIRNKPKETDVEFRKIREALETEDKDKLGLSDARFRLESLWTKDGSNYYKDLTSKYPKYGSKNPLVGKGTDEGYFRFEKLLVGDYKLTEIQAPYGYQVTDSYWRLEVREDEKGNLTKTLYEVKKDGTEKKVDPNKDSVYQITNKARKTNVEFKKYLGELEKDSEGNVIKDKNGKPIVKKDEVKKKLYGENNKPVSFDLYSSDFYGAIIGDKDEHGNIKPIKTGIIQDDKGIFHLNDLEFGKYYILRETNPPAGYDKANDILLKVEAEAVSNVGEMKVIVRDPNANTEFGEHAIFKGVIDFKKGEQLGSFSIKKTGRAIYYLDENGKLVTPNPPTDVGLRRAYFRLYTANSDFSIEKNAGGYPKEYIQKVTPGVPIILYLTEAEAKKMTEADRKNLGVVDYKNFTNNHGDQESYAVDKDGKRFRIGQNPNNLPENQGIVTFDNLKPGYYVLEEFRGPAGYERTTQQWYVKVDEKGRTIRSENKNDPAFNGQGLQSINYFADPSSSPRFRMANLDISEPLQLNRQMSPSNDLVLQKSEYDASTDDLNIKVQTSDVDTKDGKRTINLSISPKDKVIPGKKVQMVFLVERSKDSSLTSAGSKISDDRTQDKNINYAITQIAKKAKETGTSIDASFVEYTYNASDLKTTNVSLDEMTQSLEDKDYSTFYVDGEGKKAVSYKDYIGKANLSARNDRVVDGSEYLNKNIDTYLSQISAKDGYDKKIMIDFASFNVGDVKKHSPKSGKYQFYKADLVNKFKNNGFDTFVSHVDQRTVNLASGFQSQYAYETMPTLQFFEYINNSGSPGRNSVSYYVYTNLINKLFENEAFEKGEESYLVKDASLNIELKNVINLLEAKANIGERILNPTLSREGRNHSAKLSGINLKKGETLDFSYTINLKEEANFNNYYSIVPQDGMKFVNNSDTTIISRIDSKINQDIVTSKIKTYSVKTVKDPNEGGNLIFSKSEGITKGESVNVTASPNSGYKLVELKAVDDSTGSELTLNEYRTRSIFDTTDPAYKSFIMPESNVTVTARFEKITPTPPEPSQGDKNLEVNFTYSNSVNGNKVAPDNTSPGKIVLEEVNGTSSQELEKLDAVNEGRLSFTTKLDSKKSYRLVYTRKDNLAKAWALPNQSIYNIDSKSMKADIDTVKVNIANGNTMDIFNVDETGFRIPLRVTKVNENKGVLTGAQFKARKLLKGDPISKDGEEEVYPKYYDEAYDGVSEATGLPGDNYFRELSPGIYELEEIKTPNETYRLPKDENGKEKKWYFKVQVAKDENGNYKKPSDDDYMEISFHFEETLPKNPKDERWAIPEGERDDLLGKEIKGIDFGTINGKQVYDHFTEIIKDDHRSDPARPDAPYKGIDDVRVTNYLKTTELSFTKKDLASYENIEGAEFTLKRAKLDKNGYISFGPNGNPQVEDFEEKTKDSTGKEVDKFVKPKPYDDKLKVAKATSSKSSGLHFTNIEQGTYILEETKPAEGYKLEDNFLAIKFTTDENGAWKQEITAYQKDGNGYKKVENAGSLFKKDANKNLDIVFNNKSYIGLKFQKIEVKKKDGEEVKVESADFKLTQVDENGKKVEGGYEKTIYSYANSYFEFKYLPVGHYKLQETRAITKFEKPDPWFFEVKQDDKTHKLKIVFKNHDASVSYTPIDQSEDGKNSPELELDEETKLERPKDLKIRNYSKTNFSFQKLKNEIDEKTKEKLPLKDAYFRLTKVRFSMDEKAKSYEYHNEKDGAGLKKYVHGKKVTEYDPKGNVEKFTYDNKEYKYDENKNLISVGGQTPTEEDKKVEPDAISNATGKYSALRRSQSTGRVDFQNLGEGIYQLEEVGIPEGYQSDTKQFKWIFKVEKTDDGLQIVRTYTGKDGKSHDVEEEYFQKYDPDYYKKYVDNKFNKNSNIEGDGKKNPYKITNTKTTTELKWKKIGSKENTTPIKKDTKFVMLKTTDNPADIDSEDKEKVKAAISGQSEYPPYQIESKDGTFIVTDLAKGVYNLIETKAPDGYEKMNRKIAIKIYEDKEGLKKQFYEITEDGKLVKNIGSFEAILNNSVKVTTDKDGYFNVINKQKPYFFYLSKGFMKNVNGKDEFTDITKGKLRIKIYADPDDDTNKDDKVYEQTIDLSDDKSYRINVDGVELGKNYILEEVGAPDGFTVSKNKYRLQFAEDNDKKLLIKLMAVIGPDNNVLKGTKNTKNNRTETGDEFNPNEGYVIQGPSTTANKGPLKIVNKKTEVVFTKFGEDEKAKGGKKPLKDVKFYLEKQDPDDIQKENKGYYPLTKDNEFIRSQPNRNGDGLDYYIEKYVNGEKKTYFYYDNKIVNIENFAKFYTSGEDGKFKITGLTDGYYRIIEPEAPEYEKGKKYMKVNGPIKTFRVDKGKVYIYTNQKDENGSEKTVEKEVDGTSEATVTHILNQKPGKGEFELTKVDEKGSGLENVEFTLHKTDADETPIGDEVYRTGPDGKVKFTGLPYGYYWLKEKKTKDGYILDTKKKLIALGGGDKWKVPDKPKDDVSKSITFDGDQDQLVSTADSKREDVVYPNKAEGIFARYKFKIDDKATIKPGDHFTIHFSDNVDLDGINKDNDDKGQKGDEYFNIIGPAGLLAKAKVNDDRRSITYTFTDYVKDYKPESMSMFLQLFPNRRQIDHKQDITVAAHIGNDTDTTNAKYHYSDSINIDYRGENSHTNANGSIVSYNGYQNPNVDISSYMLRLDPDGKTFTAIVYYNPWNKYLTNKNITFTADEDIIQNSLSVKTYRKSGWGSHSNGWQKGDLPDSYDVDFSKNLTYISDFYRYEPIGNTGNTRKIYIPNDNLTQNGYNTNTYVIEIKGQLAGKDVKSLKTRVDYKDHNVFNQINGYNYYENTYTGNFETWSQFFNPGASGNVNKEIKLVNFKNKIEFAKVDGGVLSNVVDKTEENPQNLKDLGIGDPLKGAKFQLIKDGENYRDPITSDDNGIFSWEELPTGKYEVKETESPDSEIYDLPKDAVSSFTVDKDGNIVNIKNNKQILENYRKAEIRIRKTDQDGKPLPGAKFLLTATGKQKYTANIGTKQKDNTILFDKLPAGTYTLEEKEAPTGYTKSEKVWELEVTKDGKVKWTNSFDDTDDKMKAVNVKEYAKEEYTGDTYKDRLFSEILGIDEEAKTFRQKITIKAKPSELEKARLILDSVKSDLKLSQTNTKVRLVQIGENNNISEPDNTTYTVDINNDDTPNLTLRINPPYREEKTNNPVGSNEGNTVEQTQTNDDAEREYQFIVDMPYKEDSRIGAKATYQIGSLNENGKVTFNNVNSTVLDRYATKTNLTIADATVDMSQYKNDKVDKYLARDINLLTTDIGNIKNPDIYFKKVDADDENIALAGAKFEIQKRVGDDYVSIDKNGNQTNSTADKWIAISLIDEKTKGQFKFESIPDGEYRIKETTAPSGYILFSQKEFKFEVKNGKIYYIDANELNISKTALEDGEEIKENTANPILITNKKAQYPSTGGPGVWIGFMVIGLIVMFTSVLTYFKRKDKLVVRK